MSPLSCRLAQQRRVGFCGHEGINSLPNVSPHSGYCILVGDGTCSGGLQRRPMLRVHCASLGGHINAANGSGVPSRAAYAPSVAGVWGNFCVRLGIFCVRPELRKRRKNFCVRPRKILRTPPKKFAYANFAYVQQIFVRKRTEPKFCVRPENFAYVHERTKNLFVRPRKILRTSRKILRTSKKFLRTSKMLRFRGSARPEQISGLRSGSLLLLIRWHSAHGLGLLLGLARLLRLYICYW